MRYFVFVSLLFVHLAAAQQVQTVVPKQALTGTAFQLQYVVTDAVNVSAPQNVTFPSFQLVSGPHVYKGKTIINGEQKAVNNIVYTLVPLSVGTHKIGSITVSADDKAIRTKDVSLKTIPPPKASFNVRSSYTDVSLYAPSSENNQDAIISENLFIKAEVAKRECYEGEPIVATFKLYSRLQSTSEVVKTPGFYGFTAVDMVDMNASNASVEIVNGKIFNTSILRKVQLYPVHSGKQIIDAMQVHNVIEFRDSADDSRKRVTEKTISTPAIVINVKPFPQPLPENFEGAVGAFNISTRLEKPRIALNEQGKLLLIISGKGNFVQFSAPQINWPEGVEVFQLPSKEAWTKTSVPLQGSKTYVLGFSANKPGPGVIPPVQFSFFNPAKKAFETITTDSLYFEVKEAATKPARDKKEKKPSSALTWSIVAIVALLSAALVVFKKRKRKKVSVASEPELPKRVFVAEIEGLDPSDGKEAVRVIQNTVYDFLKDKYGTANLQQVQLKIGAEDFSQLQTLLAHCQEIAYTNLGENGKSQELKKEAISLLKKLQ